MQAGMTAEDRLTLMHSLITTLGMMTALLAVYQELKDADRIEGCRQTIASVTREIEQHACFFRESSK